MTINTRRNIHSRRGARGIAVTCCAAMLYAVPAYAVEAGSARQKDTLAVIADVKDAAEKIKRKYQTSDQYRFSKNRPNPPGREDMPVTIRRNQNKIFALDTPVLKFGLIAFTAAGGQPFAGLSAAGPRAEFVRGGMPLLGGQYAGKNLCLTAVIPGDAGKLAVWNAFADGAAADSMPGSLVMKNYTMEKTETLKTGRTVWDAKTARAKEYRVKANAEYTVMVWLPAHAGVLYVPPQGRRTMYYGGEEGARYTIEPDGGSLFLFSRAEGGTGRVEMETCAPLPPPNVRPPCRLPQCELSSGVEVIRYQAANTTETIRVKSEPFTRRRLYLSGSAESAVWISQAGRMTPEIKNGDGLSGESGVLTVKYAPGRGKIRLCRDDGANECRWGEAVKKWGEAPLVKEMTRTVLAEGVNWYSIELPEPAHVSVRAPLPAAAAVAVDGKIRYYEEFEEAFQWDIPLARGKYTIGIKPAAQGAASGVPLTIGFYPVSALTEEQPLETYLMPGQKKMAAFEIEKGGNAGLWMAASDETAEAVLMDRVGKKICGGRQLFAKLDRGRYYVLLSAPPSLTPITSMPPNGGIDVKLQLFGPKGEMPDSAAKLFLHHP